MFLFVNNNFKQLLRYSLNRNIKFFRQKSIMCDIAVCQFTATNNKLKNLITVERLVTSAVNKGAKIVFLPEGCDFICKSNTEVQTLAEPLNGPTLQAYQNLAKKNNVWLSVGGFHELSVKNKINNAHIMINGNGELVAVYRKLHLFDVCIPERNLNLNESEYVERGSEIVSPVDTPAGPIALSICYDLRFPELSILQRKNGAAILTFPSAFTNLTGVAHWEILLRSRAIENQCYVVAAAQYGKHNDKRISYGNSMVVDPWGKIIAECPKYKEDVPEDESVAIARIDLNVVNNIRLEMPVFEHRRIDMYELKQVCTTKLPILNNDIFKFSHISIPADTVFYKTKYSYAFTNLRCVVPGHVLVSSLRVVTRLEELTNDEVADLFQTVKNVVTVMERAMSASSCTVCVQDGKEAGQTVQHVHVHVLPRGLNDFENNDDIYEKLAKHDKDESSNKTREISEMINEAKELKKYFYND